MTSAEIVGFNEWTSWSSLIFCKQIFSDAFKIFNNGFTFTKLTLRLLFRTLRNFGSAEASSKNFFGQANIFLASSRSLWSTSTCPALKHSFGRAGMGSLTSSKAWLTDYPGPARALKELSKLEDSWRISSKNSIVKPMLDVSRSSGQT